MKKRILILILVLAVLAAGCASGNIETTQSSTAATTLGTTAAGDTETTAPETTAPESTQADPTEPQQTQPEQTDPTDGDSQDDYLALLKAQSDLLKASIQEDNLTQAELNQTAQDLYKLWDDALNDLWGQLRDSLPEDEFDKLLDEQLDWIEDKENAVAEAGEPYEGGSIYPLVTNREAARITEERVYTLYALLK